LSNLENFVKLLAHKLRELYSEISDFFFLPKINATSDLIKIPKIKHGFWGLKPHILSIFYV